MRINLGIRRRLAPLLGNDRRKIELLNAVLFSLPGTPVVYYGDEIGMGDNVYLGDRDGVRTPMQWSPDRNAGFSTANPQQLYLPYLREYEDESILCVANLAGTAQPVELDLSRFRGRVPVEMMGRSSFPPIGELPYFLTIAGHGFFWFRLDSDASVPEWHSELPPSKELVTLVLSNSWDSFFPERLSQEQRRVSENMLRRFKSASLPRFLDASRWFPQPLAAGNSVDIAQRAVWSACDDDFLLLRLSVASNGETSSHVLPLALAWGGDQLDSIRELLPHAVARVRDRARTGLLFEALRTASFCAALLDAVENSRTVQVDAACLVGTPTSVARSIMAGCDCSVLEPLSAAAHHESVLVDDQVVIRLLREAGDGQRPELETWRFLTEQAGFDGIARLVGDLAYEDDSGRSTLAIAVEYRRNQGEAERYLKHYLDRFLDEARLKPAAETQAQLEQLHAESLALLQRIGQRTAELHLALAEGRGAFEPLAIAGAEPAGWKSAVRRLAEVLQPALGRMAAELTEPERQAAERLLQAPDDLGGYIEGLPVESFEGLRCLYHGDLHLGRTLITEGDIVISDFADDPLRGQPVNDRRDSPLRDLADLLASLELIVQMTLRGFGEVGVTDSGLVDFAFDWHERAASALVDAYFEGIANRGLAGPDCDCMRAVTELFVVERLLTDICHPAAEQARRDPGLSVRCLASRLPGDRALE
jgi:maltose alpha-D-glucosyltransferase/alpha-amylase